MLNDGRSLDMISEMYQCLGEGSIWTTCVVCWRAWYAVSADLHFSTADTERPSSRGRARESWFAFDRSKILEQWAFVASESHDAHSFLDAHYTHEIAGTLRRQLIEPGRREIAVCVECGNIIKDNVISGIIGTLRRADLVVDPLAKSDTGEFAVVRERWQTQVPSSGANQAQLVGQGTDPPHQGEADGVSETSWTPVLGYPLDMTAPPLAALSDFEEMVIALVHPLVQVYTIPTTGEHRSFEEHHWDSEPRRPETTAAPCHVGA